MTEMDDMRCTIISTRQPDRIDTLNEGQSDAQ